MGHNLEGDLGVSLEGIQLLGDALKFLLFLVSIIVLLPAPKRPAVADSLDPELKGWQGLTPPSPLPASKAVLVTFPRGRGEGLG